MNKLAFSVEVDFSSNLSSGREWSDVPPRVCYLPASFTSLCKLMSGCSVVYGLASNACLVNAFCLGKKGLGGE